MATIKSYSDLQQSEKLAEILPLESADMYWFRDDTETPKIYPKDMMKDSVSVTLPCWSLAALLDVLPKGTNISTPDTLNKVRCSCWNDYDITYASSPVDACYEMIIKLHELNLL